MLHLTCFLVLPTFQRWQLSVSVSPVKLSRMLADTGPSIPKHCPPRTTILITTPISPHLLAPTASNLKKYGEKDTILAGFHTDINFLTIHGRSRYPGLNIWARNTGKRIPVKFPPTGRYLLVQAGKQLEHLSGGLVTAGYHEVVVNDATLQVRALCCCAVSHYLYNRPPNLSQAIERRRVEHPDRPLIRISSTFFWHLSSDYDLAPIPALQERACSLRSNTINLGKTDLEEETVYEPMKVGQQVIKCVPSS